MSTIESLELYLLSVGLDDRGRVLADVARMLAKAGSSHVVECPHCEGMVPVGPDPRYVASIAKELRATIEALGAKADDDGDVDWLAGIVGTPTVLNTPQPGPSDVRPRGSRNRSGDANAADAVAAPRRRRSSGVRPADG